MHFLVTQTVSTEFLHDLFLISHTPEFKIQDKFTKRLAAAKSKQPSLHYNFRRSDMSSIHNLKLAQALNFKGIKK